MSGTPKKAKRPRVVAGKRVYAVGDIHGQAEQLGDLLRQIEEDAALAGPGEKVLVTLGDYIDRGRGSREVLELLAGDPLPAFKKVHLLGNHDAMFLDFLDDPDQGPNWLMNGGDATCRSYLVEPRALPIELKKALAAVLPERHLAFLRDLGLRHIEGDYLFVHAGIRPGRPLDQQDREDLLWIRDRFTASPEDHGFVVVHGHTPSEGPDRQPNRIGIDTGACYGGNLTCLVLEEDRQRFLTA